MPLQVGAATFAFVCVLADAAASQEWTWVGYPQELNLQTNSYTWTFDQCSSQSGPAWRITSVDIAVQTECPSNRAKLSVTAGCPVTSDDHVVPNNLCEGLTSNDYFFIGNGQNHTVHPDVELSWLLWSSRCEMSVYVSSATDECIYATVTPTVYYNNDVGPIPIPPEPPLPPMTETWDGEEQRLAYQAANRWDVTLGDLDPPGVVTATFYEVHLDILGSFEGCDDQQRITVSAGCRVGAGAECTGFTVQESFLLYDYEPSANYSLVRNMSTNVVVSNVHGPSDMFTLIIAQEPTPTDFCFVLVSPSLVYHASTSPMPAPTSAPATPAPASPGRRTPAPPTSAPGFETPVPITPGRPTPAPPVPAPPTLVPLAPAPGHMCPEYAADAPNTVAVVPCGAAACRTPAYFPLNKIVQACDPCVDGLLPFNLQVVAGAKRDEYTLTFVLAAGKVLTLSPACGTCSTVEGLTIALPCTPKHDEHSNTTQIVAIVAGVLGGALLGWAVKMLYTRYSGRKSKDTATRLQALEESIFQQQQNDGKSMYQVVPEESNGLHLQESNPSVAS